MVRLSVNINKFATLRNSRGGNNPNVIQAAQDCERFGAQGITVHPRPDERHIRYRDVIELKQVVNTEFNIEGYPDRRYMEIIKEVRPTQATIVPDPPDALTSNAGWNTLEERNFLRETIQELKELGSRVSVFVDPHPSMIEGLQGLGADRIELFTEPYAREFLLNPQIAVRPYQECANIAHELGLQINAGHDLDLHNLRYLKEHISFLDEVSIGHALVCDAIYLGLENTIQLYLREQ